MRYLTALLARTKKSSASFSQPRSVRTTAGQHKRRRRLLFLEQLEDRKLLTAGMLDPSFGVGGLVTTDFGGIMFSSNNRAQAVQANGKILVAGSSDYGFAVARYNVDGSLDPSFGIGGRVTIGFGLAYGVAMQGDKIVVVGVSVQVATETICS